MLLPQLNPPHKAVGLLLSVTTLAWSVSCEWICFLFYAASDLHARVDQIPWIQRDIEQSQTCQIDVMLETFLQRASRDAENQQSDLLARCLKAVLPVCNGRAKSAGNDRKLHSSLIKELLEE